MAVVRHRTMRSDDGGGRNGLLLLLLRGTPPPKRRRRRRLLLLLVVAVGMLGIVVVSAVTSIRGISFFSDPSSSSSSSSTMDLDWLPRSTTNKTVVRRERSEVRSSSLSLSLCDKFLYGIPTSRFCPQRFLETGAGSPYWRDYQRHHDNFTEIPPVLNARFLVFQPPKEEEDDDDDDDPNTSHARTHTKSSSSSSSCSIVHYHIHKNGGTTLERHVPLPTDNYYSKREKEMGHEAFELACTKIMNDVWHRQQQTIMKDGGDTTARFLRPVRTFTFLRDPVERFVSSVSQILKLRVWHTRLYPCYERNTTEALLDCVLDKMEGGDGEGNNRMMTIPEMHLAPQAFELYKQVMGHDIFIDVADLSQIDQVMKQLGAVVPNTKKERSTTGSLIRRFPQFRLTTDALNDVRIRRICNIYAVDVKLLQETNVTKTACLSANNPVR